MDRIDGGSGGYGGPNDITDGSIEGENNRGDGGGYGDVTSGTIGVGAGDCGDVGGGGPMASEPPCTVAITTRRGIHDNRSVPPFLLKLYKMVDDKATNSIVSWGSSSTTFIVIDERRFISEILPCYFKTSRLDNFISQLNNYGFKKKGWKRLEFEHEHFQEGKRNLLVNIKRRNQRSKVINNTPTLSVNTCELEATFAKVEQEQKDIKNKIQGFKDDIEKTFFEIQDIINDSTNKLAFAFSEGDDRKRKFVDINLSIDFVDIEKDFESICDQFEVSGSDIDTFVTLSESMEKVANRHDGGGGGGSRVPKFLHKLYDMVEKDEIDYLISWNLPYRNSFVIWDVNQFATRVLPMYFSHTNFSSFNSQLNIYGFKKISWERHEYANEWFVGGRIDLLSNIKRREKNVRLTASTTTMCSSTEIVTCKNQLKTIQQEQANKIIWLSNYEQQMKTSVDEFKGTVVNIANIVNKMILKSNENLDNVKKVKPDDEDDVFGNGKTQDLEVEDRNASTYNNNVEAQDYFDDLEIDLEAVREIMEMEDTRIIEREMELHMSLCYGKSSEIDENFSFDHNSCS